MIATAIADDDRAVGEMAGLMRLLGDPTRIRVLHLLGPGEMNVSALCEVLDLAQPTVSHHLGLLRNARLVQTRRSGKQIFYSLHPDHVRHGDADALMLSMGPIEVSVNHRPPPPAVVSPVVAAAPARAFPIERQDGEAA